MKRFNQSIFQVSNTIDPLEMNEPPASFHITVVSEGESRGGELLVLYRLSVERVERTMAGMQLD